MAKCRQCFHARPWESDPLRAYCIADRRDGEGVFKEAIKAKTVNMTDEACERFLDKKTKSRKELLESGF